MRTPGIIVIVPDPELCRSVIFVLAAHGYRSSTKDYFHDLGQDEALVLVDEDVLPVSAYADSTNRAVIVLSRRARPSSCPYAWRWLEKSHLGEALPRAVEDLLRPSP